MAAEEQKDKKKPIVIIAIGMAGAGKSTFVNRISSHLGSHNKPAYVLNLDPAVVSTAFESNIDIRDTVNYHEVMRQWVSSFSSCVLTKQHRSRYNLGPNGGILTALNLFTTKFDQVLTLVEKRADTVEYFGLSCLIFLETSD